MSKKNAFLVLLLAVGLVALVINFYVLVNTMQKNKLSPRLLEMEKLKYIWSKECKNGGIGYDDKCICPPSVLGDQCEIDECTQDVVVKLENAFFHSPDSPLIASECIVDPKLFQCYKDHFKRHDEETASTVAGSEEYLKYLLHSYGPWTPNDKLLFNYWMTYQTHSKDVKPAVMESPGNSLAFAIFLHDKIDVFLKMWPFIYRPHNYYVIHLDSRASDQTFQNLTELVRKTEVNNNTQLLYKRFHGEWGSISLVYMEVAAILHLLAMSKSRPWSHVINLSGSDFPVQPIENLERFLADRQQNSFMYAGGADATPRLDSLYLECPEDKPKLEYYEAMTKVTTSSKYSPESSWNWMYSKPLNVRYPPGFGSQWWILSRDLSEYIASDLSVLEILFSMKFTLIPDELFFQTVVESTSFKDDAIYNNYRWVNFKKVNLRVVKEDITSIRTSGAFFARKFNDDEVLEAVIRELVRK